MSLINESQLRRAIRAQIIRTLSEGKEEAAAETKEPLSKVLHRAVDIFDENAPEPKDGSDNRPTSYLGKRDGKVAFFVSGAQTRKGKQYPLLQTRGSQDDPPAYPSESALRKAVIDAIAKAFSEHKMLDHFRTVEFGDLQYTELKSGLYGYVVPTTIPVGKKKQEGEE